MTSRRNTLWLSGTAALDKDLVNAIPYRKSIYANGPFPTSTTIQVNQLLLPELMIEIEVTACRALP